LQGCQAEKALDFLDILSQKALILILRIPTSFYLKF
jgi:hypothetical protein